ncbi:MAG: hypothetical protein R6W71_09820 [Bacteroidales bacterium]
MKHQLTYLCALLWLITAYCSYGQYNGGDHDGFGKAFTGVTNLHDPSSYCSGGDADGFHQTGSGPVTLNDQSFYCKGGIKDGFSNGLFAGYFFNPVEFYNGGTADGWASGTIQGKMFPSVYSFGGTGDGWAAFSSGISLLNLQGFYCSAGEGDGYASRSFSGHLYIAFAGFSGGAGDGFRADVSGMQYLGCGIWTGTSSPLWSSAHNWKYNILPDSGTLVVIPAGALYYPQLSDSFAIDSAAGDVRCKRLDIFSGGQMTAQGSVTINGTMNISGLLTFLKNTSNTFQVLPSGNMVIKSGGEVRVE